jgi:hypothetical protein
MKRREEEAGREGKGDLEPVCFCFSLIVLHVYFHALCCAVWVYILEGGKGMLFIYFSISHSHPYSNSNHHDHGARSTNTSSTPPRPSPTRL